MIYRATEEIADHFDADDIRYEVEETENASIVHIGVKLDAADIEILFISINDEADVTVRAFDFIRFPDTRTDAAFRIVNTLNSTYRFITFTVDEEKHTVDVRADLPTNTGDIGDAAFEMFFRMCSICREAYPQFMHAIWS